MYRNYLAVAAILGATGVMLGAFGAHGLQRITSDEKILQGFHTAVYYQLYHAIALFALAILAPNHPGRWNKWAFHSWWMGIVLFSGSLYLLTYLKIQESDAVRFVGPVTPVGGLLLIAGWLFLLLASIDKRS